jgi:hypothetical protein
MPWTKKMALERPFDHALKMRIAPISRPLKRTLLLTTVALCAFALVAVGIRINSARKRMTTQDTFGQILVTLDKTLTRNNWQLEAEHVEEVRKEFPNISVADGHFLDQWSRPISLKIELEGTKFVITLASRGPDAIEGTPDDMTQRTLLEAPQ